MPRFSKKDQEGAAVAAPSFFKKPIGISISLLVLFAVIGVGWSLYVWSHPEKEKPIAASTRLSQDVIEDGIGFEEEESATEAETKADDELSLPVKRSAAMDFSLAGDHIEISPQLIDQITQHTETGPLPKISSSGLSAFTLYSRRMDGEVPGPKVAIIIRDLGLSNAALTEVLQQVPTDVTLAMSPYSPDLTDKFKEISAAGYEGLLMLPTESAQFGYDDTGKNTLLVSLSISENVKRLEWILSRGQGYFGVLLEGGSRLTLRSQSLRPILEQLRRRGVAIVDGSLEERSQVSRLSSQLKALHHFVLVDLDTTLSEDKFDQGLLELEQYAQTHGSAIGVMRPYALSLKKLKAWMATLESRDVALVPASQLVKWDIKGHE